MRADEVRGMSELARLTLRGSTTRIREVHQGIADRAFGALGTVAAPVKIVHDPAAGVAYSAVRLALGAGARVVGRAVALGTGGTSVDKVLGPKETLRGSNLPIIGGFPFLLAVEVLPAHLPLPARIRTELLDPIEVDPDPDRADHKAYVQKIYDQVEAEIQAGMDRLAAKRTLPVFG